MVAALKPGFRNLATLKVVVNVVGELWRKEQLRQRAVSLRFFLLFLFWLHGGLHLATRPSVYSVQRVISIVVSHRVV